MVASTERPRLRPLELKWLEESGRPTLFLRDPSGIAPHAATVPAWLALLLSFFDGERGAAAISAAFELQTGQAIPPSQVQNLVDQLDEALFLDSPRFHAARAALIQEYRAASFRPAAHADRVYPASPTALARALDGYNPPELPVPVAEVRGIVSPHIDYNRGGPVYAKTWHQAAGAVRNADLVVVFGTDHSGGAGRITLTRQNYATPYGVLPTAVDVVDAVAEAIGADSAYGEELHHRSEHSIELAAVWLHHVRVGPPPKIVPVLCGSFYEFTEGNADPKNHPAFDRVIDALRAATAGQRVLAVAAADLAHVGPAFGDPAPLSEPEKQAIRVKDEALLKAICSGDAAEFFRVLRDERDCRRICGLPPIYLMLRFLGASTGQVVAYDQCPADASFGSLVSVAGVLLT